MASPTFAPEPLESRIAPAGLVAITFENGVLKIAGDSGANEIDVTGTSTGVTVTDLGMGDTQFSFEGELVDHVDLTGPIRRLAIDLPNGPSKVVNLVGLEVEQNIRVTSVSDDSRVTLDTVDAGGVVKISASNEVGPFGGGVSIIGGATIARKGMYVTAEEFNVSSESLRAAELFVSSYAFADIAPLESLNIGVRGLSLLPARTSMAEVLSNVVSIAGSITLETSSTPGSELALTVAALTRGTIDGSFIVHSSDSLEKAEAVSVTLGIEGGILNLVGDLDFTGTAGADTLNLGGALAMGGDLIANFAEGTDLLNSNDLQRLRVGGDVRLTDDGGSGLLDLGASGALTIGGNVEVDAESNSAVSLFAANVSVAGELAVRLLGDESNVSASISVGASGRLFVAGATSINNLGSTDTSMDLSAGRLLLPGGLTYLGTTGADILTVDAGSIGNIGQIRIEPGNGRSEVSLTALAGDRIGPVNYIGGIGDDIFTYNAPVKSTGPFLLDFNGGNSSTLFASPTPGLRLSLTQRVVIRGADFSEGSDSVEFRGVNAGRVVLDLGPGDDDLVVADSAIRGVFSAALGDGADVASIEIGSGPESSIFRGTLLVDLGAGNDELHLGEDQPGSRIVLNTTATFNGGPGTDTRSGPMSALVFKAAEPIFASFE